MKLPIRTWYKIHKWTAIVAGIALVMWLVTGVTMSWEYLFPEEEPNSSVDYRAILLSPSEVVTKVEDIVSEPLSINWITLTHLGNLPIYEVQADNGYIFLIDAISGENVTITPQLATEIAQEETSNQATVSSVELIERYGLDYPAGPIPVYKVEFTENNETDLFISVYTGSVQRISSYGRFRKLLNRLHDFGILNVFTDRGRLITAFLIAASLVTIVVAILGYYLALPRRWQLLNRRK